MPRKKKAKKKRTPKARGPKEFSVRTEERRSTVLSGDLQGLSRTPGADSESVSELVEEGNPFEAEIVNAVEAADDITKEVRTREVPEVTCHRNISTKTRWSTTRVKEAEMSQRSFSPGFRGRRQQSCKRFFGSFCRQA